MVYLDALERQSKIDEFRLKELEEAVNQSATRIQRFWRRRRLRRRLASAILIQHWWKKKAAYLAYFRYMVSKFRRTYYLGKIQLALLRYIRKVKHLPAPPDLHPPRCFTAGKVIFPILKDKLMLHCNLEAESQYMSNLLAYNKVNFTREWETYESQLIVFIEKQIAKQWIKKNGQWIDESGKVRDKEKVIRRELGKVFDAKFEKF